VEVVRALLLIVAMGSVGCVESLDELPPVQQNVAMQPPDSFFGDTFWLQQSIAAMREPPRLPVRSISLGYIGDTPLSGGVMRDTPMQPAQQQPVQQQAPCACALRGE